MATGTYTGDGVAGRAITGLGFQPDIVLIRVDYADAVTTSNAAAVMRTSTMTGDNSKVLVGLLPLTSNLIQSLGANDFTVGNDLRVNALNLCGAGTDPCTYYWTAWKANANVAVGTYTGNGSTQSITGLSFSPDYVITLCACASRADHRTSRGTNQSMNFSPGTPIPDGITSLDANGFTVQDSVDINDSPNISGQTYHYIAWNEVAGQVKVGEYPGNGIDDRAITGVGFQPEYVIVHAYNDSFDPFQRSDWMPAEPPNTTASSMTFGNSATTGPALRSNRIQRFLSDGFEVGTGTQVNDSAGACSTGTPPGDCLYSYVAFNVHGTTNYRSIGTAPNRSTATADGTVSATQYSVIVTGSGTQWQTWNRGRGDVITIDGTDYIVLSVDSETELRLTTPFTGTTGSGKSYTIARQFTTLQAWTDCIDGPPGVACPYFPVPSASLVADNRSEVGIAYKDSPFVLTSYVFFDDATTDAAHTITLTADPPNRHHGVPGAGVLIDGNNQPVGFRIEDDYVTVEWLEFVRTRGATNIGAIQIGSTAGGETGVLVQYVLVHDFFDAGFNVDGIRLRGGPGKSVTVRNSMAWDGDFVGIEGDDADTLTIENCSVDGIPGWGIHARDSALTIRNTIVTSSGTNDFMLGALGSMSGSNNTSSDGTAATYFTNPQTGVLASDIFVTPNSDLHLRSDLLPGPNSPLDSGLNLSSSFLLDIDGGSRALVTNWDRGADEREITTAVELVLFTATSLDSEVLLEWETGSELNNLGFHLYRALSEEGPYERITPSVIPGLGSSPEGARYRYVNGNLVNGITYFYKLEDIETTGATKLHGPVSATPLTAAGSSRVGASSSEGEPQSSSLITYGNPSANRFAVVYESGNKAVLELITEGFYAEPLEDGTVQLSIPGFEALSEPFRPSLPLKRPWVQAVAGLGVKLESVEEDRVVPFTGLRPSGASEAVAVGSREGAVRLQLRQRLRFNGGSAFPVDLYPRQAARVLGTGYQGEAKKVQVELAPLRWDGANGRLLLAQRLVVSLRLEGRARRETLLGDRRGRLYRSHASHRSRNVVARLATKERGLHVVRHEDVLPGWGSVPSNGLRLGRLGKPVAFHIEPNASRFGPGSRLYFLSQGAQANPYGNEAVYELEVGTGGELMAVAQATPVGEPSSHYRKRIEQEVNRYYQAALLTADDPWLWDVLVAPVKKSYAFEVRGLTSSDEPARLWVGLQGASDFAADPDHHLRAYLNGALAGEVSWEGKAPENLEVELLPGQLVEGTNVLELENVGDTGATYSMVFLDRFAVEYPRTLEAEAGLLEGRVSDSGVAEISGVGSRGYVLDVTDETAWMRGLQGTGDGALRFRVEAGRSYLVVAEESLRRPEVRRPRASYLKGRQNRADYLVVGPATFLDEAQPLLELRRSEGLRVKAVSVEQVYEEFGFGEERPEALGEFLAYAYHRWRAPAVRYVLLLGDGTYDFKNYLGTGAVNRVPPLLIKTSYLWTASDPTLAAVNGEDLLPDVAIGRLPAATEEELGVMVAKILAQHAAGADSSSPLVLVADNPDSAGDFQANAEAIASGVLGGRQVRKLYLSELGPSAMRSEIVEAFDEGASLMSYIGHGGIHLWANENVFNLGDVSSLAAQSRPPLFVTMNCLNGYFHFPYFNSLSEQVLKAEGRGAIAAFSPSGLSLNQPAHVFHEALLNEVFNRSHDRLGDAVLAAQEAYAETGAFPELVGIYHLLGDPALRIH